MVFNLNLRFSSFKSTPKKKYYVKKKFTFCPSMRLHVCMGEYVCIHTLVHMHTQTAYDKGVGFRVKQPKTNKVTKKLEE